MLQLTPNGTWYGVNRAPVVQSQQSFGVYVEFKYTPALGLAIHLKTGTYGTSDFRRWGVYGTGTMLYGRFWGGSGTETTVPLLAAQANVWYRLYLKIDAAGDCTVALWQRDAPTTYRVLQEHHPDLWRNAEWSFVSQANVGALTLDNYRELAVYPTSYAYDVLGSLTAVTDTLGNVTTLGYDALGRKVTMDDPDMGQWTYHYDKVGNLIAQIDAKGQATNFYYDSLDRLIGKTYATTTTPSSYTRPSDPGYTGYSVSYRYDESGQGYAAGRRTEMSAAGTRTTWVYDARGRVTQEVKLIDSAVYTTSSSYDALDRVVTLSYPDGEVITTTYNAAAQPVGLQTAGGVLVTGAAYNALGQLTSLGLGNGITTAYTYQSGTFRLQRVQAGSLLDLEYGYDAVGNVTQLLDRREGVTETLTYSYDGLDRLVRAQATGIAELAYTQVFTYNAIGNLTGKSDVGLYTYPASGAASVRPHAVTETTSGWAFSYDANGNMTSRTVPEGTYQLSYTWENRLAAITETTSMAVTRYVYDADGVLVKKVGPEGTTHYVGGYYEKNVTTDVATSYYTFGGQRVAMTVTGTLSYLYTDHLGSASLATDATGDVTAEIRYYPYGETRWSTGTMAMDRRYTGQREETGLELYDYVARRYDPRLGRFLQADTIVPETRIAQTLNRYMYTRGNPLKYNDPTGHDVGCAGLDCGSYAGIAFPPTYWCGTLAECMGRPRFNTRGVPIVGGGYADFAQGEEIRAEDFEAMLVVISQDLEHEVTVPVFHKVEVLGHEMELGPWGYVPGGLAGRGRYDTPFWNESKEVDPQVCVGDQGCFKRSEVNYVAQGMWGRAAGETLEESIETTRYWNESYWHHPATDGELHWTEYGWNWQNARLSQME